MLNLFGKYIGTKRIPICELPELLVPLPILSTDKCSCAYCGKELHGPWDTHPHYCKEKNDKEKFTLTFDEPPALVFVQERGSNKVKVYQDGKELQGVRSIAINASIDDIATHVVEYITGQTGTK